MSGSILSKITVCKGSRAGEFASNCGRGEESAEGGYEERAELLEVAATRLMLYWNDETGATSENASCA